MKPMYNLELAASESGCERCGGRIEIGAVKLVQTALLRKEQMCKTHGFCLRCAFKMLSKRRLPKWAVSLELQVGLPDLMSLVQSVNKTNGYYGVV